MPPEQPRSEYDAARADYRQNIANEIAAGGESDVGFAVAIGSPSWQEFDRVGQLEAALLVQHGLLECQSIVDVGCGSGRLARSLPDAYRGTYTGTDISAPLLAHATAACSDARFHFLHVDGLTIPLPDSSTDMVAMFSLLTHLRHEEAFLYLREARRVLRPGGTVVFSFLDFSQESHWSIFHETVAAVEAGVLHHVNQFMSRDLVSAWAKMLEYVVVNVYDGQGQYIECSDADGTRRLDSIGQSVAVWRKP
jgi:ubiquinone/menaquinone biosynthesis C-methylase UbiE